MTQIGSYLLVTLLSFGAHALSGGYLGFHDNSEGSPLFDLLKSATKTIDVEIYEMDDPRVFAGLRSAMARGVRVRIVQEPTPMATKCKIFSGLRAGDDPKCVEKKNLVAEVNAKGGLYKAFSKNLCGIEGKSCFQHGKLVIVDGTLALISSGNFNISNLCNLDENPEACNRDYTFVTNDREVVLALEEIFTHDLDGTNRDLENVLTKKLMDKITVSPISLPRLIDFIGSAKTSIQVQNQYLHEPQINEALIRAAKRGVKVEATVSSLCYFDKPKPYAHERAITIYSSFDEAGISSRFFTRLIPIRGKSGYLHSKAFIIDDTRAWIGSMNGSKEAATMNREYGIFFDKPEWVKKLSTIMSADHKNPGTESWRQSLACEKDAKPL